MEQPAVPGPETASTSATDPDELLALFAKWEQPGSLYSPIEQDDADQLAGTDPLPGMKIEELW
jgi:hypothetical protein